VLGSLRKWALAFSLAGAASLIAAAPAAAQPPGALDPTFAGTGVVNTGGPLAGALVGSDGTVFAAGASGSSAALYRFGAAGQAEGVAGGAGGIATGAALQSNGDVVVALTGGSIEVERFKPGGALDTSFGNGGVAAVPGTAGGQAAGIAVGPGDEIVVAGSVTGGDTLPDAAVGALTANGAPQSGFGAGGLATFDLGGSAQLSYQNALAVAVQSNGAIVVAGASRVSQVTNGFIARLTPSGAFDSSFGNSSGNPNIPCAPGLCFYYHPFGGSFASLNALTFQPDGRIIAAGIDLRSTGPGCTTGDCPQAIALRFSSQGVPDTGFGTQGVAAQPSGQNTNTGAATGARSVTIGGGGDIVAAGDYQPEIGTDAAVWAFRASGAPDTSFGSGGAVIAPAGASARSIFVSADGNFTVAGSAGGQGFVARYVGLGPPPAGGGSGPPPSPPVVQTGSATLTGPGGARLTGSVNPEGQQTSYYFQYGRTRAYGSSTQALSAGAGSSAIAIAQALGGLHAATTYHFRIVATSSAGTSVGGDQQFTTSAFTASIKSVPNKLRISSLAKGLTISVACDGACTIHAYLNVSAKLARALGLRKGSVTIVSGSRSLGSGGSARVKLRLGRGLASKLTHYTQLVCKLRLVVVSPSRSGALTVSKRLVFH